MPSLALMYHDVHAGEAAPWIPATAAAYHVSTDTFSRQLALIKASGCRVLTIEELELTRNAKPSLSITFDDGWAGAFERALPLLEREGWKATVFVTRDFVGRKGFCTPAMIVEAARAGHEIGVHGTTHRMLSGCSPAEILEEFNACKEYLEGLIGRPVGSGSLPGGDVNEAIIGGARKAGLRRLCTSRPGVNTQRTSPLELRRIAVRRTTSDEAMSRYCGLRTQREVMRWIATEAAHRVLGMGTYSRLRRWLLDGSGRNRLFEP